MTINLCSSAFCVSYEMNEAGLLERCRVCARVEEHAVEIFSSEGRQRRLVEKMETVLPISVSKNDLLPLRVCESCEAALEASVELRELSLQANHTLNDLLLQQETSEVPELELSRQESLRLNESPVDMSPSQSDVEISTSPLVNSPPSTPPSKLRLYESPVEMPSVQFDVEISTSPPLKSPPPSKLRLYESPVKIPSVQFDVEISTSPRVKSTPPSKLRLCEPTVEMPSVQFDVEISTSPRVKSMPPSKLRLCESPVEMPSVQFDVEISSSPHVTPSSNLQCQLCSQNCSSMKLLKEHYLEDHHCYMCVYCCQWFALIGDTKAHINQCHRVQCKFCKKRVIADNMEWHYRHVHKKLAPKCIPATRDYCEYIECTICEGKNLGNKHSAKMHYFWEHLQYACDVCLELFSSSEMQIQHTEEVHMIPCWFCKEKFYTSRKLKRHVNQNHREQSSVILPPIKSEFDVFECRSCKKGVSSKLFLKRHNFWSHGTITCDFCMLEFRNVSLEEQHFREAHSSLCGVCHEEVSGALSVHLEASHPDEQPFCCESCGQAFCSRDQLARHRKEHETKRVFLCDSCGKSFRLKSLLLLHNKFKHLDRSDSKVTCEVCSKKFVFDSQLKRHMLQHTQSKQFKCLDCFKCFSNAVCLKRHMKQHMGKKRHTCAHCGAQFDIKQNLRSHIKTMHSSQEVFKCCICEKCFDAEQDAYLHASFHNEEHVTFIRVETLQCELCDERFSNKTALEVHMQGHPARKKEVRKIGRKKYERNIL